MLKFKKGELTITERVRKEEAERVGNFLVNDGFFSDDRVVSVQLDKKDSRYEMRFVVGAQAADNLLALAQFGICGQQISSEIFAGSPVDVLLTDSEWNPIKRVPPSGKLTFGASEIYYSAPVSAETAKKAAAALLEK